MIKSASFRNFINARGWRIIPTSSVGKTSYGRGSSGALSESNGLVTDRDGRVSFGGPRLDESRLGTTLHISHDRVSATPHARTALRFYGG
jgi:hypothetical protein